MIQATEWTNEMPAHHPDDNSSKRRRAKSVAAPDPQRETELRPRSGQNHFEAIDWLAIWSLSIAFSALVMAAVLYDIDKVGVSVVLAGAAGLVALVLLLSEAPNERD